MKKLVVAIVLFLASCVAGCANDNFSQIRSAVVELKTRLPESGKLDGFCSGVVIAPQTVLTAAHCDIDKDIYVRGYRAFILKKNAKRDLMLLHVPVGADCPCVKNTTIPKRDETVFAVGFPLEAGQVLTEGRWQHEAKNGDVLFTSPVTWGNSGGGVFVRRNGGFALVGIVSRGTVVGLGFFPVFIGHLNSGPGSNSIFEFITEDE